MTINVFHLTSAIHLPLGSWEKNLPYHIPSDEDQFLLTALFFLLLTSFSSYCLIYSHHLFFAEDFFIFYFISQQMHRCIGLQYLAHIESEIREVN